MLRNLIMTVWKRLPAGLRRWSVRATNVKFTVTAAGIIRNGDGKVLLLQHRFRPGSGWGIPGGFLESGEQAEQALRRELREEVNLDLDQVQLFTVRTFKRQNQIEVVFLAVGVGEPDVGNVEVNEAVWFPINALPDGLPSDQKKLIESALHVGAGGRD